MKQLLQVLIAVVAPVLLTVPAAADILLNEVYANPPGGDNNREYIEILTTSGSDSLSGVWLLEIESDKTNTGAVDAARGTIDNVVDLSSLSFGPNGLLVLGDGYDTSNPWGLSASNVGLAHLPGTTIENEHVLILVTHFTGEVGDDLDTNNDNVFDTTPWVTILDSVAYIDPDGDLGLTGSATDPYSYDYLGVTPLEAGGTSTADALARFPGNTDTLSTDAWYGGEIDGGVAGDLTFVDPTYFSEQLTLNFPLESGVVTLTPGAPNIPTTVTLDADFDDNNMVDANDFADWQAGYGMTLTAAKSDGDADGDGDVDGGDFLIWQREYGSSLSAGATTGTVAVPEPATAVLALFVVFAAITAPRARRCHCG